MKQEADREVTFVDDVLDISMFAVWMLGEKLAIKASSVFISSVGKGMDIEF